MNKFKRWHMLLFLSFIFTLGAAHVITADRDFSEEENRVLSQMPSFTWNNFFSGKFTSEFEQYVSDQFAWKSFWTGLKASVEKGTLKQENNGVFFGKNGYLLEPYQKPGKQYYRNLEYVNFLGERLKQNSNGGISLYFLLVPTSIEIYADEKPWLAPSASQLQWLETAKQELGTNLSFIDVYETLQTHKEEPLYFRTDHHWTMRGAYYAYANTVAAMGLEPYAIKDFEITKVSDNFYGTYDAKAHLYRMKPDFIEIFQPRFKISYAVTYEQNGAVTDSLYEWDYLKKRDQYAVFLGGNHSLVKIETSVKNNRKLAVIKDSYAHAMLPFLANHFEEVHVIDLRYNHTSLTSYMEDQGITDVLLLYNLAHFSEDTNLIWLKQ